MQDLWSRLLAAAMDPNRRDAMRQSFITTVKQMDPIDALVLKATHLNRETPESAIASKLTLSSDEIIVSVEHLANLNCITRNSDHPRVLPFGKLLMAP